MDGWMEDGSTVHVKKFSYRTLASLTIRLHQPPTNLSSIGQI